MEANIIHVGNSKGIIIPAKLIKLLGIRQKVKMAVEGSTLVLEPLEENSRKGWTAQFLKAGSQTDQSLLLPDVFEDENLDNWQW